MRTSKGWVTRAETVPLVAPETNEITIGVSGGRMDSGELRCDFVNSKPAQ